MADVLNILTPTPIAGPVVRVKLAHQAAIVQLAAFVGWPEVQHTRGNGFTVRIPGNERSWLQFAIDGRRKDQFAVLSWLAEVAHNRETEDLLATPPTPYVQIAAPNEPVDAVQHNYTTAKGEPSHGS